MGKIKRWVLEKKWERYHDLSYKYFDQADNHPVGSKERSRCYDKHLKYMNKRVELHSKLYGD